MLYFIFSIYTDNSFFANMFLELIVKKIKLFVFCVSSAIDFDRRELEGLRWLKEADKNEWVNRFAIILGIHCDIL